MKVQGNSLSEIAAELEVSKQSVQRLIIEQIDSEADLLSMEDKRTLLALENARIEHLIKAHWESAMYGDLRSGDFLLRCIALHAKINKLDIPDAQYNQNTVLVIGGEAAEYIERLKSLSA